MSITYGGKYSTVINLAKKHNATEVSIQYHIFVNFSARIDAEKFSADAWQFGLKPWTINTQRPYVPFEVIIEREK